MATENRGVMVYLPPEIEEYITSFCAEYNITRKDKEGNILPSLGTGVVTYLKSKISGESPDEILTKPSKLLGNGLNKDEVLDLIREHNTSESPSNGLTRSKILDLIKSELSGVEAMVRDYIDSLGVTSRESPKQPKPEGALTRNEIAEKLGKSRQAIEARRDKGTLEEWSYRAEKIDGNWYYFPIEQPDQTSSKI
jgi:hypothetical protein